MGAEALVQPCATRVSSKSPSMWPLRETAGLNWTPEAPKSQVTQRLGAFQRDPGRDLIRTLC